MQFSPKKRYSNSHNLLFYLLIICHSSLPCNAESITYTRTRWKVERVHPPTPLPFRTHDHIAYYFPLWLKLSFASRPATPTFTTPMNVACRLPLPPRALRILWTSTLSRHTKENVSAACDHDIHSANHFARCHTVLSNCRNCRYIYVPD